MRKWSAESFLNKLSWKHSEAVIGSNPHWRCLMFCKETALQLRLHLYEGRSTLKYMLYHSSHKADRRETAHILSVWSKWRSRLVTWIFQNVSRAYQESLCFIVYLHRVTFLSLFRCWNGLQHCFWYLKAYVIQRINAKKSDFVSPLLKYAFFPPSPYLFKRYQMLFLSAE